MSHWWRRHEHRTAARPLAMSRTGRWAAVLCLLLLVPIAVQLTRLQVLDSEELRTNPANRRIEIARWGQPRGDIMVGGTPVTGSRPTGRDLAYARTYADGPLYASVTGYASQLYGSSLLEGVEDRLLDGTDPRLSSELGDIVRAVTRHRPRGGQVLTTIQDAAQRAAFTGLGDRRGAVVALDPATGAILALVSTPSYDPSALAEGGSAATAAWTRLLSDPAQPMLNRALRETYPPGSTFKVVTAAAALSSGRVTDIDAPTNSPDPYTLPLTTTSLGNASSGCEDASLAYALAASCNTVFAKLGADLGAEVMGRQARAFGFGQEDQRVPIRVAPSVFPASPDRPQTALSAIGQFDTRATPLQMAMVAAAVVNDGTVMRPYLVDLVTDAGGRTLSRTRPSAFGRAVRPSVAGQLRTMMEGVVTEGTGRNARIPGVVVGGKTGTAQHGVGNAGTPYAWFISYALAPGGDRSVAVAVVVEDAEAQRADISGGGTAAPIAREVMQAVVGTGAGPETAPETGPATVRPPAPEAPPTRAPGVAQVPGGPRR